MQLALLFVLAAAPAPQSWQFQTDGTPTVSVANINGSIRVEATDGRTVSVEATQEGSEEARARTQVRVEQDGDEVEVKVCCGSCSKGRSSCNNPADTHFVLKVPRESKLEVATVGATVTVSGVEGAQDVSSVNGRVELKGSRKNLEVSSVSADVVLVPGALARTEVSTVSGGVKLKLPDGVGATVDFSSVGGSFNGRGVSLGSKRQRYGDGAHEVEVSTVGGSLEVQSDADSK